MSRKVTVEICVGSVQGVLAAEAAGADRAELCSDLVEGGITPSAGTIHSARERSSLGLMVIVRPRGGDFLYSDEEFEVMKYDIQAARDCGADGVVLGLLQQDGAVDCRRTAELVQLARPMSVTFHRAFDMTPDPHIALQQLLSLGVDRVLTSGQEENAHSSMPLLRQLIQEAGEDLIVMPGGGLTRENIAEVVAQTGAHEVHFAALQVVESSMQFKNPRLGMAAGSVPGEYQRVVTDEQQVREMLALCS
jgi:copper homeostasis protein